MVGPADEPKLGLLDFNEVANFTNHAENLRVDLFFYGLVHFPKAQSLERIFLTLRTIDQALDLGDFNFCHCVFRFLPFEEFLHRNTTLASDRLRATEFL